MSTPQISFHHRKAAPHILVMDESREVLALLHEILAGEGFSLTLSNQLLELEQIRACSPALILMDRRFDGLLAPAWDVVHRTSRDPDLMHVPIVLSTTYCAKPMSACFEKEILDCGVHVLLKPYAMDDLLETIQACLSSNAESREVSSQRLPAGQYPCITSNGDNSPDSDHQVHALLFPDGRVVIHDDPLSQLANWSLLGRIRQDGELRSFLRVDAAGNSWTAFVPSISLEEEAGPLCIPLQRQSGSSWEPLTGWPLFC